MHFLDSCVACFKPAGSAALLNVVKGDGEMKACHNIIINIIVIT